MLTGITEQTAKRKANGWLIGCVGNMLMADHGVLVRLGSLNDSEWAWRFEVFVTSLSHEPSGPIGIVNVDANSGAVVDREQTKVRLYERGYSVHG